MKKIMGTILGVLLVFLFSACKAQKQSEEVYIVEIDAKQLYQMLQKKDFILINVHIPYEGESPQTDLFIPYDEIEKFSDKLPQEKDTKIIVYCRSDTMSTISVQSLTGMEYTNILNLRGGMKAWGEAGYDLIYKEEMR